MADDEQGAVERKPKTPRDTRTEEQRVRDWLDRQLAAAPEMTPEKVRRICLLLNPPPAMPSARPRIPEQQDRRRAAVPEPARTPKE